VRITVKTVFLFFLIIFMGSVIYSKCLPRDESYKRFVEKTSLAQSYEENEKSIRLLKKHLKCHPEKEVFYKLAVIYEYSQKHYLAEIAYQKAGKDDDQKRMEQLRIKNNIKYGDSRIKELTGRKAAEFERAYKRRRVTAISLLTTGAVFFGTGFGLFIHDKAFNGTNSPTAQFSLMFAGLSLVGGGIFANGYSAYYKHLHQSFLNMSEKNYSPNDVMDDYYVFLVAENNAKHSSVRELRNHSGLMIMISIPMLALSVYSMYEAFSYLSSGKTIAGDMEIVPGIFYFLFRLTMVVIGEALTLAPAVLSLTGGIIMLNKASKYEKLNTEPSLLTLNSIAPIIDPVSKTYGLSMGFSF
jgi:hypothetical protein